jgi:hypothetical protein
MIRTVPLSAEASAVAYRGGLPPNADKFKILAICDLNPERPNALADEFMSSGGPPVSTISAR